jgi:hypothetical protein
MLLFITGKRPGNRIGPWPFSRAAVHTTRRPRHGPGSGFCFPTWAAPAGPHVVSRPSSSNDHAWNPVEQNRRQHPRPNPSAHFSSPSLSSTHAAMSERPRLPADERPSARRGNRPVAPSWAPRRRARIHKWCTGEILIPTTHRLAVVQVLFAWRTDPRPAVVCEVKTSKLSIPTRWLSIESPLSIFFYPDLYLHT